MAKGQARLKPLKRKEDGPSRRGGMGATKTMPGSNDTRVFGGRAEQRVFGGGGGAGSKRANGLPYYGISSSVGIHS